jgi:hypothetical protein
VYGIGDEFQFRDEDDNFLVGEDVVSYGIIFKSKEAPVMTYGRDLYLRAINSDLGGGDDIGGQIVIDADRDLVTSACNALRLYETSETTIIGQKLDEGTDVLSESIVNFQDKDNHLLSNKSVFRAKAENAIFDSGTAMLIRGPISAAQGVVAIPGTVIDTLITDLSTDIDSFLTGVGDSDLPAVLTFHHDETYTKSVKGDETFVEQAGFTLRNRLQYGLNSTFVVPEARWQQAYRNTGLGRTWDEPAVIVPGGELGDATLPHPGRRLWLKDERYAEHATELWDWKDLRDIDRVGKSASGEVDPTIRPYDEARAATESDIEENGIGSRIAFRFLAEGYLISRQIGAETSSSVAPE